VTIPSDDPAFREHVRRTSERFPDDAAADLEARLRLLFPRAVVRARGLSSEPDVWYVYRDGAWRPPEGAWWEAPLVPMLVIGEDGWVGEANVAARSLLGIDGSGPHHHYSDFVAPAATEGATMLFRFVVEGHPLSATLVLRPIGGDPIACEVRAERNGEGLRAWFRLAEDVELVAQPEQSSRPLLATAPAEDAQFAAFAERQLHAMAEPSSETLGLRLRRLYPHARVVTSDAGGWIAQRDGDGHPHDRTPWWTTAGLPLVRFDDRGLILEANQAATDLLGQVLVGRHWHELATPGSHNEVQPVLDMLRSAGEVVSRFRLPAADGRLVDFDSHTRAVGDEFETTMRASGQGTPDGDPASSG
jgi:PAS domain-containing protein